MQGFGAKVDMRLRELEAKNEALNRRADELLSKYIALLERLSELEAKRGPGRPPKNG